MGYDWESQPLIEPHSINKLALIEDYYSRYLNILGKKGIKRNTFPLCFVDGFCGAGEYDLGGGQVQLGSPLLTLQAALQFEGSVNPEIQAVKTKFKFFFVDTDPKAIRLLKNRIGNLRKTRPIPDAWEIILMEGEFEALRDTIIQNVKEHSTNQRAIFFLDQYGYKDVSMPTIWKILSSLKESEVILTISLDWLVDYSSTDEFEAKFAKLGFAHHSTRDFQERMSGHSADDPNTRRIYRMEAQKFFHTEIIEQCQLSVPIHQSPYIIESAASNKSHIILHLARNLRAKEAMIDVQWKRGKDMIHEGPGGLNAHVFIQLPCAPFLFQEEESCRLCDELKGQLLERIPPPDKATRTDEIYKKIANLTPARKEHIYRALRMLFSEGYISAKTEKGNPVRKNIHDNTMIALARTRSIFLP